MKKLFLLLIPLTLLFCFGCGEMSADSSATTEVISIDPADYGITEEMLHNADSLPDFSEFELTKLGAYLLNSYGAFSEGAAEELYQRFRTVPGDVLGYLTALGNSVAPSGKPAAEVLSNALANAEVLWNDTGDDFSSSIDELKDKFKDSKAQKILNDLHSQYEYIKEAVQ